MNLTPEKKALMFKALAEKPAYEVGIDFGLDKYYKNAGTIAATVNRLYNKIKNNPEEYNVSLEVVEIVSKAVTSRAVKVQSGEQRISLREKLDNEKNKPLEEIVKENSQKASVLLSLRLDDALSSKRKREKISIGEIAKVYGITFDKRQLVEGRATDHVSIMSKLHVENMSPAELIEATIKMREYNESVIEQARKHR